MKIKYKIKKDNIQLKIIVENKDELLTLWHKLNINMHEIIPSVLDKWEQVLELPSKNVADFDFFVAVDEICQKKGYLDENN